MIISPWDQGQTHINLETKHVIYQKLLNLCRRRISMLAGLKVPSSPMQMCILQTRTYGEGEDPMELNFEGLEMAK